jgi:uncharacterized repeat protein (TIGR04076 family)
VIKDCDGRGAGIRVPGKENVIRENIIIIKLEVYNMDEQALRFQSGFLVEIELIGAKNESACRFGYKVGDKWVVSVWENSGLCGLAYNSFFPFITMYQTGGLPPWKTSGADARNVVRTCPDLRAGFQFRISRKEA